MNSPSAPKQPSPATARPPRLRSGQLRDQVLILLADRPQTWTVSAVARELGGRSSGAVGEALDRLAVSGMVQRDRTTPSPKRYTITATGLAHATTIKTHTPAKRAPAGPAGSTTPPSGPPPVPDAVLRPGGAWYVPRPLLASTDVEVLRRLRTEGIPVLLTGPPGTGKTALVEAAFPDVLTVCGHGDAVADDLFGTWMPNPDGTYTFTHGPLPQAMREGRPLFIDDATLIPPATLAVLYPAMDGRATITIPTHHNETITAAPGFWTIAGHNPGVHGAVLTEALASRFTMQIQVTTDLNLARSLGVPEIAVTIAKALYKKVSNGEINWAPQLRELLACHTIHKVLGLDAAIANLAACAPDDDRPAVLEAITDAWHPVAPLSVGDPIHTHDLNQNAR